MKRPLTLTGAILGVVANAINAVYFIISLIILGDIAAYAGAYLPAGIIVVYVLLLGISIAGLVLSILTIKTWNKDSETYRKKKGLIITSIVFNFVSTLFLLTCVFISAGSVIVYYIILMLMIMAAGVLCLVDLCLEGKRSANNHVAEAVVADVQPTTVVTPVAEVQPAQPVVQAQPVTEKAANTLEDKIEKLNSMKENGLITDEEYKELKANYIKEQLGK